MFTAAAFFIGVGLLARETVKWIKDVRKTMDESGTDGGFHLAIGGASHIRTKAIYLLVLPLIVGIALDAWIGIPLKDLVLSSN
jgi:hypothetical protein